MLFQKKEMDKIAAKNFWIWFAENEEHILTQLEAHAADVVWEIDAELRPVFSYFKKDLEFELGHNEEKAEFNFFHMGNRHLKRHGTALATMMPTALRERWDMNVSK